MQGLDAWLEAPYVQRAQEEAAFEAFCEREDVDPEAPDAWDRFEAYLEDLMDDVPEPPEDWDRDPRDYE